MTLFAHLLVIRDGVRSPETATYRCTSTSTICARAASAYSREESRRLERFREREGLAETRKPPDAPRMGRSSSRIASVTATPGSRCWSLGKSRSTRFHAPKLPPARGGEREWSCLSLHRVVVLALFPRLLPRNANVPHSPSHAKGRESGHMPLPASLRRRDPGVSGTESLDGHRREVHARRRTDREGSRPHKVPSHYPAYVAPLPIERGLSVPQSSRSATSLTRALSPHRKNSYPVCCCGTKPHSPPHAARRESGHASPYISQVRPASSAATLQVETRAHISPGVVIAAATRVRDSRAAPRPTE